MHCKSPLGIDIINYRSFYSRSPKCPKGGHNYCDRSDLFPCTTKQAIRQSRFTVREESQVLHLFLLRSNPRRIATPRSYFSGNLVWQA